MKALQNFFLVCSGAEKSILKRTPTEINRYTGIGATIFFTGLFAFAAAGYALYTVFGSVYSAILFGLLWGLMIFNLDRYIVSTMRKKSKFFKDFAMVVPRIVLAVLIAFVIAKPLELKIFESEINAEIALMQQENRMEQENLVRARFEPDMDKLNSDIQLLKSEIEEKESARDLAVQAALVEADGTGGSQRRNMGPIYAIKKKEADNLQSELDQLMQNNGALIDSKQESLSSINDNMTATLAAMSNAQLGGLASRMEAMSRLGQKSNAIFYAGIFIMLLFIAIETAPIFVKLIADRSPYDFVLDKHEFAYRMNHMANTQRLESQTRNALDFELKTSHYKTGLAIDAEKQISKKALEEHLESIKQEPLVWKDLLRKGKLFQLD